MIPYHLLLQGIEYLYVTDERTQKKTGNPLQTWTKAINRLTYSWGNANDSQE